MKKFIHLLGLAILSLSMTISLTSCNPDDPWGNGPDSGQTPGGDVPGGDVPGGGDIPGGGGGTDPTQFSGNIDANTTWPDLGLPVDYVVSGTLRIRGNALLTIEPGVTIMFDGNDGFLYVEEDAGISMVGTPDKPIIFTGPTNNPNNGSWEGIAIYSKRNDNRLEYVQFIRGGSADYWDNNAVVAINGGKVHMNNCLIDGGLKCGLFVSGDFYSFENNTIKNVPSYPVWIDANAPLYSLGSNNTYIANGKNMIYVDLSSVYLEDHVTLKKMSIPYYFPHGYDIYEAYKYTIEPGVTMFIGSAQNMDISTETTLIANGTIDAPITIRGLEDEPGYWNGIYYNSQKAQSVMNYVNISGGGYNDNWSNRFNLQISNDARLTITNCVISNSQYYGIELDRPSVMERITHSNNTFLNCQEGNVWLEYGGEYNGVTYEAGQILPQLP